MSIAEAMKACCKEQYELTDVPPITVAGGTVTYEHECPDGSIGTGTITCPDLTIPGPGIQVPANQLAGVYQTYLQYITSNNATNAQNDQFQNWLAQWQDYQDLTVIPYFAQLILAAIQAIQAYDIYLECLDIAKDAKECVRDEVVGMKTCVQQLRDAMCTHYDELAADNVERLTSWGEKGEWACGKRDEEWSTFVSYRDKEQEHIDSAFDKAHAFICTAEDSSQSLAEFTTSLGACFDELKTEQMPAEVAQGLKDIIAKLKDSCDWMTQCAEELKDDWDLNYKDASANYSEVALNEANALVQGLSDIDTFVAGCRDLAKDMWSAAYSAKEEVHIPALLQEACDLTPELSNTFDLFKRCMEDKHMLIRDEYCGDANGGEFCFGRELIDMAKEYITELRASHDDLDACADDRKAQYDNVYQGKENLLAGTILQEACDLMPCLATVHQWLCDHADDMQQHWDEYWKAKEEAYVCDVLDKALARACELDTHLTQFCVEGDGFLDHWKDCYQQIECRVAPKLIAAAERACEKQEAQYGELCAHTAHLWEKFERDFCPCDTKDLLEVCAVWEKCHPINELCANHECQQEIADVLKDCYLALTLPCEKAYIREVCEMQKYDPQYCEMESAALLHIKKQFDRQREQLLKGSSRYCHGATKQLLVELASQQASAEAAALAAANRWEWSREVQECNRRHRYHMETLTQLGERHIDTSLRAYAQDTALLDQILGRIHERLVRGYEYVRNHNDYARSIFGATQAAVQAGEQAIQLGHFWPAKYCELKAEYDRSSLQWMNHSAELIRLGQFYPQQAAADKVNAASVAQNAVQLGQRTVDHGHRHVDYYFQQRAAAGRIAAEAINQGLAGVREGHFWAEMVSRDKQAQFQIAQAATEDALNAYRIGQDHMRAALAMAQEQRADAALAAQAGENAASRGLQQMQLAATKMDNVLGAASQAISQGNGFIQNGLRAAEIARNGHESSVRASSIGFNGWQVLSQEGARHAASAGNFNNASMSQLANQLQMTCEFLRTAYCCLGNHFHTSGVGIARAAGAMVNDSRDAFGQAGADIIGGIAGLNQPPPFPQAPFGTIGTQTVVGNTNPAGAFLPGGYTAFGSDGGFFTP